MAFKHTSFFRNYYPGGRSVLFFILLWVFLGSCQDDEQVEPPTSNWSLQVPAGFPEPVMPFDNQLTASRVELGRHLFYDPILSRDSSISCGSCHHLAFGLADTLPTTPGIEGRPGLRNVPGLANVAYHPYFMREGGISSLEMQVAVPVQEHNEFDFNMVLIAERLQQHPVYADWAWEAYDRPPDPFVISRSIAAFERTLLSGNAPYDQYYQQDIPSALGALALTGRELFFSDSLACSECHYGFNFTNYHFDNNGLYETYEDLGRMRLTGLEIDRALFKVPSLRNVGVSPPYMHDGSLPDLRSVIDHYASGGKDHPHKSELIQGFTLTSQQKDALEAFLNSLTDHSFITNPAFAAPE
jgi:cytochrome c peroxidase